MGCLIWEYYALAGVFAFVAIVVASALLIADILRGVDGL